MFETHKIDSFFSGENNPLDAQETMFMSRRTKVVRFFRLFLPCLTALLLGSGIILFDFETNSDAPVSIADDDKIYFEKFRMKNTVFEVTEKDNQLSTLKADVVEEITPGKKLYSLINPKANTLDKDKKINIVSKKGQYNQNKQELYVESDVVANYNNQMEIKTNSATYNFKNEYGFGNEHVTGNGEKGYFEANKFTYDKKKGIVALLNNVYMKSGDTELKSPDKALLFLEENKFISTNANIKKANDTLSADKITVFFKDTKNFDVTKAFSKGNTQIYSKGKKAFGDRGEYNADNGLIKLFDNVKIVDGSGYIATANIGIYDSKKNTFTLENNVVINKGSNTVTAPKAIYFTNKEEFRFYDNVKVIQDGGVATAKHGVYYIKKNLAELENQVVITKDGNVVRGDKAISDFNTSKSRLIAKNGGRISGKLIEKTLKK